MTQARRTPPAGRAGTKQRHSAFHRGEDGMRRTNEELERQKQRAEDRKKQSNQPFRYYVPVGETKEGIILDDKPDFFMYEHGLQDDQGRWGRLFCGCVAEFANCPACEVTKKEGYYAMVLTVLDLTPYETKSGDVIEFSRKLLIVKAAQQKKFLRMYEKNGTLRGALIEFTRDGAKDASIGNDIELVEFVDEKELKGYVRKYKDRDGKKVTEDCSTPFVYEDLFEEPTEESIRALVGGSPSPGSRDHEDEALGGSRRSSRRPARSSESSDDDFDEQDEGSSKRPARSKKEPARSRGREEERESSRKRPARRAEPEEADEDADDEDTDYWMPEVGDEVSVVDSDNEVVATGEVTKVTDTVVSVKTDPKGKLVKYPCDEYAFAPADDDEDDEDDDDEDDEDDDDASDDPPFKPTRRVAKDEKPASKGKSKDAAPATARRRSAEPPEDDGDDEGSASTARRKARR